jgi:ElaB/YqjD/DUF883 family membrane-anchored ribosome-binding protein
MWRALPTPTAGAISPADDRGGVGNHRRLLRSLSHTASCGILTKYAGSLRVANLPALYRVTPRRQGNSMDIFISMSDMVADADDLLRALGDSSNPDIQVLRSRVESSIDDMKTNLRQRLKSRAGTEDDLTSKLAGAPRVNFWLLATVAVLSAALLIGAMTHRRA